jgi:hypothetical protein
MTHDIIEDRSLELHRCVAKKLRKNPSLLSIPMGNLKRWLSKNPGNATDSFLEWQRVLRQPLEKILDILTADDEEGRRLRQSTPFTGILTEKERSKICKKYEALRS